MKHFLDIDKLVSERSYSKVILGYVGASLFGMLGALVGGYGGYVYRTGNFLFGQSHGAGVVPIITAAVGFAIFFSVGACVLGPGQEVYDKFLAATLPGDMQRYTVMGLSSFDLYVTVHRIKNLFNADPCTGLVGGIGSPYVEVIVGRSVDDDRQLSVQRNPPKRTCISNSNAFEECFHFVVSPTDDAIRFAVYDADLLDNDLVGRCDVNITDDVLAAGFPQKKAFKLARGDALDVNKSMDRDSDHHAGSLVVSFTPGVNFPQSSLPALRKRGEFAIQRMQTATEQLRMHAERTAGQYGTLVSGKPQQV